MSTKTRSKRVLFLLAAIICFSLISLSFATAIKAKIGNSRMVLRPEVGEDLEKYIRVINDNQETVTITFLVSGELSDNVKLEDESFVLAPQEEKNAYFTIRADKPGKTETKINVVYTPEEGNGVGLTSTIIVIPEQDGNTITNLADEESEDSDSSINFKPSASKALESQEKKGINFNLPNISSTTLMLISTLAVTIGIIFLFFYYSRTNNPKKIKHLKRMTKWRG